MAKKAADYAKRHNVPRWYDDADALINDPEVNAIYVATPPDTHAKYAIRSMRAGKPVYVEKPMARNTDECRDMIAVSNQTGQALYVAYYRRALPYFEKIRELIEVHAIGDIRMVNIVLHAAPKKEELDPESAPGWRVDPLISGGGHFHDLASHQFDYLEYIFGSIKIAGGLTSNQAGLYDAEDIVTAIFEFENGILGTGSWCFSVAEKQEREFTEIIGSKGKITFSFFGSSRIDVQNERGRGRAN